jgi:hypothetical protein
VSGQWLFVKHSADNWWGKEVPMGGIFDRLQGQLSSQDDEGGITPLDLAELPPALRKIMRLMLREVEMTSLALHEAAETILDVDRMEPAELDEALDALSRQGWLIKMGEENISYRVNLRRKAGSSLGLWASLQSRIEESEDASSE